MDSQPLQEPPDTPEAPASSALVKHDETYSIKDALIDEARDNKIKLVLGHLIMGGFMGLFYIYGLSRGMMMLACIEGILLLKLFSDGQQRHQFHHRERRVGRMLTATSDLEQYDVEALAVFARLRIHVSVVWGENKKVLLTLIALPILGLIGAFFLGAALLDMSLIFLLLMVLCLLCAGMLLCWEVVFPPADLREEIDVKRRLIQKRRVTESVHGAMTLSVDEDISMQGALTPSDSKGALTQSDEG